MLLALVLFLQVTTSPTDHYELGMFRAGNLVTPFSLTQYPLDRVSCGHLKTEDPVDGIPNPAMMSFVDPADATKECRADIRTPVISLPLGAGYKGGIRSVDAQGNTSVWNFTPFTFRRAPRGQPCPGGMPGVLIVGEADLNGAVVSLSICVQR